MSTGQTMLTIFAFALLSTTLISFYRLMGLSADDISKGQDGILTTTIATSYLEIANGVAFDEKTDTSDQAINNPSALTSVDLLGADDADEDSVADFDDFDDFDGFQEEKEPFGTGRRYTTMFEVNYVDPLDVAEISAVRTFVKRMDLRTWRSFPPSPDADTLRLSFVLGYFHFD